MRRKLILAVAALAAVVGCQRESAPLNPTYNPQTNEVITQFVFNVSTKSGATKQSDDVVQATSSSQFRGIEDAILLAYSEETAGLILTEDKTAVKKYDLSSAVLPNTVSSSNNRRVLEMSLPLKTNTLLFYGKAPVGDKNINGNVKEYYGALDDYHVGQAKDDMYIHLGTRLSSEDYPKFVTVEKMIAGIMSMLLNETIPDHAIDENGDPVYEGEALKPFTISKEDHPEGVATPYVFDVTIPAGGISWKSYSIGTNSPYETDHERYPLEDKMCLLYKQLTTIRSGVASATNPDGVSELRAGSGEAVLRMAKDLWSVINAVRCATPLSEAEAVAKYMAADIHKRLYKYYIPSEGVPSSGAELGGELSFCSQSSLVTAYFSPIEVKTRPATAPADAWVTLSEAQALGSYDPTKFPFNFNIPRGATHIAFNKEKDYFYYPQTFDTSAMGGTPGSGDTYNAQSYFYPAELLYFGNSPIRTTSKEKSVADFPKVSGDGDGQWGNDSSWDSDWTGNQVDAATRAVAMKYDINYGVAMLETFVKYADGLTELNDNNHAVQNFWAGGTLTDEEEPDKTIEITDTAFQMTGLIIGGQTHRVGWNFLPMVDGTSFRYGFIYDKAIPTNAGKIPTPAGSPNYTLVFDNFNEASANLPVPGPQDIVYVAVEFKNNTGSDFYGNGNLIRNGGYFYLIGALDPAAATNKTTMTWPTTHVVPPYNADGTSKEIKRVFIQDFKTTATFTLGANSLHYAYLTVPDLRSSSMSLGLSVDLKWETGLNFEEVILGGE